MEKRPPEVVVVVADVVVVDVDCFGFALTPVTPDKQNDKKS